MISSAPKPDTSPARSESLEGPIPASNRRSSEKLTVYFDGACPLCSREIDFYQRKDTAHDIRWIDITQCDASALGPGLTTEAALKRFHARLPDGGLLSGARAFTEVWLKIPRFRLLGRIARLRALRGFLEILYRTHLLVRPSLQRLARFNGKRSTHSEKKT